MKRVRQLLFACTAAFGATAMAEPAQPQKPVTLRIASVAPEGTAWAHEAQAFARDLKTATQGGVQLKLILNGIAGDEFEMGDRMARRQLDGVMSGGMLCAKLIPSMKAMRVLGLFQNREESSHVLRQLDPTLVEEARVNGYTLLGTAGLGADIILLRNNVSTLKELKTVRLWRWDADPTGIMMAREMGWNAVPFSLVDAAKAYDTGKVDGFQALASGALAFQWYAQAQYVLDLPTSYLSACLILRSDAVDRLPPEHQEALHRAAAKFVLHIEQAGIEMDRILLKVFQKHGLKAIPVSDSLRTAFFESARLARERLGEKLVPRSLIDRVLRLLADYRAAHH